MQCLFISQSPEKINAYIELMNSTVIVESPSLGQFPEINKTSCDRWCKRKDWLEYELIEIRFKPNPNFNQRLRRSNTDGLCLYRESYRGIYETLKTCPPPFFIAKLMNGLVWR